MFSHQYCNWHGKGTLLLQENQRECFDDFCFVNVKLGTPHELDEIRILSVRQMKIYNYSFKSYSPENFNELIYSL